MDAERNIDALIFELDRALDSDNEDNVDEHQVEADNPGVGGPPDHGVDAVQEHGERRPVNRYLSSSSAKRRMIKQTNCNFCPVEVDRESIEEHLQTSNDCLTLYLRHLHLKSLEAVILKIYPCLFCQIPFHKLSLHLQSQPECLRQFKERFGVTSLSAVVKKISNLKKQEFKSRRSLERQFENARAKAKKKAKLEEATPEVYLNKHIQQTTYSNYKRCVNCLCDLSLAEEVTQASAIVQTEYDFESFSQHKRANKYFLCRFCIMKKESIPEIKNSFLTMTGLEGEGKIVFVPVMAPDEPDEINFQPSLQRYHKDIKVMLPAAVASLQTFSTEVPVNKLSRFEIQHILFGNQILDDKLLAVIYQNQLSKYQSLGKFDDLFKGEIEDNDRKLVTNLQPYDGLENNIRGSSKSEMNRNNEVYRKFAQFGKLCLFLSTEIPIGHQTVATNLIQRGFVVTTSYNGEASQELDRKYFVHQGHSANSECNENNCQRVSIEEYLETTPEILQLTNENIGTYICSLESFVNSFVSNIITSPVAPLSAQEYHFQIKFNEKGIARLEGIIWPSCLQKINLLKIDKDIGIEEANSLKQEYLEKIQSTVISTSDPEVLKTQLRLTEVECDQIQSSIAKYQTHFCGECSSCQNPPSASKSPSYAVCHP